MVFWILGFLDFVVFYTCVPICRNSSKIGFGKKTAFVSRFTVLSRSVRVVGGDHIYIYLSIDLSMCVYIYAPLSPETAYALTSGSDPKSFETRALARLGF